MNLNLDSWQKEFLETKGNKILCTGRQVGKSLICSIDAANYATKNANKVILMIAPTERQAGMLFEKTLNFLMQNYKSLIKTPYTRNVTKTKIELKNNTRILCLPCGTDGTGIRGLTVHRFYGEESHRIPDAVWSAITPMLLTTGGDMILLSTPFGRTGFFFDCWKSDNFKKFHKNSEEVITERPISATWTQIQREHAIDFIKLEKSRMTRNQFLQEYMGEFVEDLMQFFPDLLIRQCQKLKRPTVISSRGNFYLGVDVGGRGGDESTFEVLEKIKDRLIHSESVVETNEMTTQTERQIIHLDNNYHFKTIYIDDGGMGVGVFDHLLEIDQTKRKTIAINNASRSLTPRTADKQKGKKLMKEDLYNNLLCAMERGEIDLLDDPEVFQSLKSIQFEIVPENKTVKIFGTYTHIAEGLIRAAWCIKDKSLNPFIA